MNTGEGTGLGWLANGWNKSKDEKETNGVGKREEGKSEAGWRVWVERNRREGEEDG